MGTIRRLAALFAALMPLLARGADDTDDGTTALIQAWHDLESTTAGDTYYINAGTWTWDTTLEITKGVSIIGAGVGSTMLRDNIDTANSSVSPTNAREAMIYLNTTSGQTYRVSGISFDDNSGARGKYSAGMIQTRGTSESIRIDNCDFDFTGNTRSGLVITYDATLGVIDNCTSECDNQHYRFNLDDYAGSVHGNGSWAETAAQIIGTDNAWFVEDCTLTHPDSGGGFTDGYGGARIVFRYNDFVNGSVRWHGTESSQKSRSTRWVEIYENTWTHPVAGSYTGEAIQFRGSSGVVYNNTHAAGEYEYLIRMNTYRRHSPFDPWGGADGTNVIDDNDTSDGEGTPGGAGDGVYESGTATGGGTHQLTDTGKSWTTDEWAGYVVKSVEVTGTATAGSGTGTLEDTGASWTTDEWVGYTMKNTTTGRTGLITANTATTVTFGITPKPAFSTSDGYEISRMGGIESNTATTLTFLGNNSVNAVDPDFSGGESYEIRLVTQSLDQAGAGSSLEFTGGNDFSPVANRSQTHDGIYEWGNSGFVTGTSTYRDPANFHTLGTDYYINTTRPGYTAFTYPHPLRGEGSSTATSATVNGTITVGQ